MCCAEERAPGCQRETRTDGDAAHTKIGESGQCKLMIESGDEDVDRFRRDGLYDLCNLLRITDAGRIEAIGAGLRIGRQAVDHPGAPAGTFLTVEDQLACLAAVRRHLAPGGLADSAAQDTFCGVDGGNGVFTSGLGDFPTFTFGDSIDRTTPLADRRVYEDLNGNGKLDTMMGVPKEGFGFSRNPALRMGPPRYDDVHFTLPPGTSGQTVKMKYLL